MNEQHGIYSDKVWCTIAGLCLIGVFAILIIR